MIIIIQCTDQVGLVASITKVMAKEQLNIVSMREHVDQELGKPDHDFSGTVHDVSLSQLLERGLVDFRVVIAEDRGSPAAHEIDIFVSVDVPELRTLGASEELRIAVRQVLGVHVSPHAARHDLKRPLSQNLV